MLDYSAGVARGAKLPWFGAGSGSMLPTINRYDAAPRRQKQPATTRGMTNDPLVIVSLKFTGRGICPCGELRPRGRREDVWSVGSGGFGYGGRQHGGGVNVLEVWF